MKTGLIYQPCGLGDILFLQKVAYYMKGLGYEVWWPVIYEFEWLNDYGYEADIPALKKIHPGLKSFKTWLSETSW